MSDKKFSVNLPDSLPCRSKPHRRQLALNSNPADKAYQQAKFEQNQTAAMFFTDDLQADYERMKARGAEFNAPPKDVGYATTAILRDGCGNFVQVTQLKKW